MMPGEDPLGGKIWQEIVNTMETNCKLNNRFIYNNIISSILLTEIVKTFLFLLLSSFYLHAGS